MSKNNNQMLGYFIDQEPFEELLCQQGQRRIHDQTIGLLSTVTRSHLYKDFPDIDV